MRTSAKIIADSVSPHGHQLTTVEVTFWRPILAEVNTHRVFSRNSASSRARSTKKTIAEVENDLAFPLVFRAEHVGMSGGDELTGLELVYARNEWGHAASDAITHAKNLVALGVHKSIVNRLLEPFMWHTAVITATDWDGFFSQRLGLLSDGRRAADDAIYELADAIKMAMNTSLPMPLDIGDWHLPYVTHDDIEYVRERTTPFSMTKLCQISVARCAGVSYLTQGTEGRDIEKDLKLYERLRAANPPHWSPFEHVASPAPDGDRYFNLQGWQSLRWIEEGVV